MGYAFVRKFWLLLALAPMLLARPVAAEETAVDRDALFQRAFSSAAYFLTMAQAEPEFVQKLSPTEKEMLELVRAEAQNARNFQWFSENFPRPTADVYEYVHKGHYHDDRERALPIDLGSRYGLEFSSDPAIFARSNGEKPRAAVAGPRLDDPIFVNRAVVNRSDSPWTFPEALQIMIHEFGHKLGKREDEAAINELAAKIRALVESRQVSAETSRGRIFAYRFNTSLFEDWLDVTLTGRYLGVNRPNRIEPFRAIDNEGLYLFFENSNGVIDMSAEMHADLRARSDFRQHEGLRYNWKPFHFFSGSELTLRELADGRLRVAVGTRHSQAAIPFLGRGDPDPEKYRPWNELANRGELGKDDYHRLEWTWDASGATPRKLSVWSRPLIEESSREIPAARKTWQGDDLVLTYLVPDELKIRGTGLTTVRPFLIASLNGEVIEIEGTRDPRNKDEVQFRFREARTRLNGELKVLNIEVEPRLRNLANRHYLRQRLLLAQAESFSLTGTSSPAPKLLRAQAWTGNRWLEIDNQTTVINDRDPVRLTFESTTPLASLKLEVGVDQTEFVQSWQKLNGSRSVLPPGQRPLPPGRTLVTIPAESLKQELKGRTLTVTFALDRDTRLRKTVAREITPEAGVPWVPRVYELERTDVLPQRRILGVEAVNLSGQVLRQDSRALGKAATCRSLFR